MKVAHQCHLVRLAYPISDHGKDHLFTAANQSVLFEVDASHPYWSSPTDHVLVFYGFASIDQKQLLPMGQPMLLGARKIQWLAILPFPCLLPVPVKPLLTYRQVTPTILRTKGEIETIPEPGQ